MGNLSAFMKTSCELVWQVKDSSNSYCKHLSISQVQVHCGTDNRLAMPHPQNKGCG